MIKTFIRRSAYEKNTLPSMPEFSMVKTDQFGPELWAHLHPNRLRSPLPKAWIGGRKKKKEKKLDRRKYMQYIHYFYYTYIYNLRLWKL